MRVCIYLSCHIRIPNMCVCVCVCVQEAFPRLKGDALQAYTPRYKGTVQHEGNEFVQVLHVTPHACMHACTKTIAFHCLTVSCVSA